jgi:hypothetical protein
VVNLNTLPSIITLLIALSVATERVVEIIKGFWPYANQTKTDPNQEAKRQAVVQALAVGGGILVALLSWPIVRQVLPQDGTISKGSAVLALGFLASGGSGFWNSILGYVLRMKDLQSATADAAERQVASTRPLPQPTEGVLS